MTLAYSFKSALASIRREKWINMLSILTVASSLLIATLTMFALYNVELVTSHLPERFTMLIHLKDVVSAEEAQSLAASLKQRTDVAQVTYISKEEALAELKHAFKDTHSLLEGLDENPLASSIELKLKKEFVAQSATAKIAGEIKKLPGVDAVYYGEKIAEAIYLIKKSVQNVSAIILLTISAGVIFVTYSTVKILFYRRNEEIEILKLLGATGSFIRAPFLIEGSIIGLCGGLLGIVGAFLFYFAVTYRLSVVIPILKTLVFPLGILGALPFIGIVLGLAGSALAIGRLRL
ncbi:MAG: permease-like cell division protein FtsX [Nitrospirota bacterium]